MDEDTIDGDKDASETLSEPNSHSGTVMFGFLILLCLSIFAALTIFHTRDQEDILVDIGRARIMAIASAILSFA
jgi:hypothetical protein